MQNILKEICSKNWEEYEPIIRRIAFARLTGLEDEVDDVVSETFTALCTKFSGGSAPNNTRSWLYGTLNNIINQHLRKICTERENVVADSADMIDLKFTYSIPDSAFSSVSVSEFHKIVRSLLSDDEYSLIEALYINDAKASQVAEQLNLTEGAVRQRSYRICSKLRKTLSEYSDLSLLL